MKFLPTLFLVTACITSCMFAARSIALPPIPSHSATKSGPTMKALRLDQTHYFFGDVTTIACKTAIRMEDTGSFKFVLVAKAPDWKVTVFRNDDKKYYSCPLPTFLDGGMVSQFLVGRKGEYFEGGTKEILKTAVDGVHVIRYSGRLSRSEYLPSEMLVAPQIVRIVYETFRMPSNGGLALRFVQAKGGTDWMTGLKDIGLQTMLTTKSAAMVKVPSSTFEAPTGYKRAKSLRDVLISNESRDSSADAKDLFEIK